MIICEVGILMLAFQGSVRSRVLEKKTKNLFRIRILFFLFRQTNEDLNLDNLSGEEAIEIFSLKILRLMINVREIVLRN
jgi:hypothetical protein